MNTESGTSPQIPVVSDDRVRRYPPTPWSSQRLYRPYVKASFVVALTLGFTTGAGMLLATPLGIDRGIWWVTHAQAHGMAQLFGFAGLFTMGIAQHVVPRFRNGSIWFPWPQRASMVLVLAAIALRFAGQMINEYPVSEILLIVAGLLLLSGASIFAITLFSALHSGSGPVSAAGRWIYVGTAWLLVSATIHLLLMLRMLFDRVSIAPADLNAAVIYSALFGFVGAYIMGVSTRAVTGFLGLRPRHERLEIAGFALLHGGLIIAVCSYAIEASAEISSVGLIITAIGVVFFIVSLRVFEPSQIRRPPISPGAYGRYGWFVRAAYFWLLIGAILIAARSSEILFEIDVLPVANASPIVHVLTVGFITSMLIGMGSRMLPLFEGAVVPGRTALDISFALLNLSVALRTVIGFTLEGYSDSLLGASGVLGLLALILSAPALIGSMKKRSREKYSELAAELGRVKWQGSAQPATEK